MAGHCRGDRRRGSTGRKARLATSPRWYPRCRTAGRWAPLGKIAGFPTKQDGFRPFAPLERTVVLCGAQCANRGRWPYRHLLVGGLVEKCSQSRSRATREAICLSRARRQERERRARPRSEAHRSAPGSGRQSPIDRPRLSIPRVRRAGPLRRPIVRPSPAGFTPPAELRTIHTIDLRMNHGCCAVMLNAVPRGHPCCVRSFARSRSSPFSPARCGGGTGGGPRRYDPRGQDRQGRQAGAQGNKKSTRKARKHKKAKSAKKHAKAARQPAN